MLSYRHAFHAGNHADVLKHFVLQEVLRYFLQKDKPFSYVDTHAGAGIYALHEGFAQKNAEFLEGISKLWHAEKLPSALEEYKHLIAFFNPEQLKYYPGSPAIAYHLMRETDKLRLFELHPSDYDLLIASLQELSTSPKSRKAMIEQIDGFVGIKSTLPPPSRRGVVLIDPPYEDKKDYQRVVDMLEDSLKRFATGTYIVWYPLLQRPEISEMLRQLHTLSKDSWLDVTLTIHTPATDGFGMHGSGLFIINPPWTLPDTLKTVMPALEKLIGLDSDAHYTLESHIR